jgi:hypothetical protein
MREHQPLDSGLGTIIGRCSRPPAARSPAGCPVVANHREIKRADDKLGEVGSPKIGDTASVRRTRYGFRKRASSAGIQSPGSALNAAAGRTSAC